jgi:4-alpha-glucanotransferase
MPHALPAKPPSPEGRRAGVLLHPTSLPGGPIGSLGAESRRFVDWLAAAGQSLWQVLPLSPPAAGGCPYKGASSLAGNPYLIAVDEPLNAGPRPERVDFARLEQAKRPALERMVDRMWRDPVQRADFESFVERERDWLDDHALFMALSEHFGRSFLEWPEELLHRDRAALETAAQVLSGSVGFHQVTQFLFWQQWQELRAYAHTRGIRIVGDTPFYVDLESVDVWVSPQLFDLDPRTKRPRHVAGVPPDMFSATGQLWGMPVYDWERMADDGYAWWVRRFRKLSELVDIIRIDHFPGFVASWQVPASERDAVRGSWQKGPGRALFDAVSAACPDVQVWVEDLGHVTPEVHALRDALGFPGMRILQFAVGDSEGARLHRPSGHVRRSVVYTGTHDNDTLRGWWLGLSEPERDEVWRLLDHSVEAELHWQLIRLAYDSVADDVIVPLQDVLGYGSEARMNVPGTVDGNWAWRFERVGLTGELAERLAGLVGGGAGRG